MGLNDSINSFKNVFISEKAERREEQEDKKRQKTELHYFNLYVHSYILDLYYQKKMDSQQITLILLKNKNKENIIYDCMKEYVLLYNEKNPNKSVSNFLADTVEKIELNYITIIKNNLKEVKEIEQIEKEKAKIKEEKRGIIDLHNPETLAKYQEQLAIDNKRMRQTIHNKQKTKKEDNSIFNLLLAQFFKK